MEVLYFLEKIRIPVLNEFMLLITHLGSETAFLVIALVMFWCVDKRRGYFILSVGFVGTILNQFMKLCYRVPRPFVKDPNFTILEAARADAGGFSFPSGHTQSAVGTFGGIAHTDKHKWVRIAAIAIAILVPFSRMYVGVHTPQDVLVSAVLAVLLILILKPIVYDDDGKYMPWLFGIMLLLSIGYLLFVSLWQFPVGTEKEQLAHGVENAYTLFGALSGMLLVYIVDEKWLNFSTKAVWWAQILKVVFGLAAVLAVKAGLKPVFNSIFNELAGRAVRYFLVVVVAGIVWPLSFRFFNKLGCKE